jgi:LDH2 family malate/lactate/ureidoglycolate dehydrogenase
VAVRSADGAAGQDTTVVARADIPFGHKIALRALEAGEPVVRYGGRIGRLTAPVAAGEHIHVHNLESSLSPHKASGDAPVTATISATELNERIMRALGDAGVADNPARDFAEQTVEAHLRGVETHGLRRIKPYLARIRAGAVDAAAEPVVERYGALLRIDGRNAIGHHVAGVTADAVAAAAGEIGAAVALIRNSNHFGFAGYYATRIARQDKVAIVTSNGQVCLGPDGALRPLLSNDPIAVAAPLGDETFFEFDMATSKTSRANVAMAAQRGEPIAPGVALDAAGLPTTDAAAALAGVLLPAADGRGFGLVAAIELLTGVITGGAYADLVASKESASQVPEGTAHFMVAIDLDKALGRDVALQRIGDFAERLAGVPVREGATPSRYPGSRRWQLRAQRLRDGIPLTDDDVEILQSLAGVGQAES